MTSSWLVTHPEGITIDDDRTTVDVDFVYAFLSRSYWAQGIPREVVERSIEHSHCFTIRRDGRPVGFARVISDRATFAYLSDVFVMEEERGRGLSKLLVAAILSHPELQGLRRWHLVTYDAHGLYRQFGFTPLDKPERHMQMHFPDIYRR